jgi:hypothetical protein
MTQTLMWQGLAGAKVNAEVTLSALYLTAF